MVMDHMADQDEPVLSNPPTWNFPHSGIGLKPNTPFNMQESRKLSAGLQTHDVEEGMTGEEMSESDPDEKLYRHWVSGDRADSCGPRRKGKSNRGSAAGKIGERLSTVAQLCGQQKSTGLRSIWHRMDSIEAQPQNISASGISASK